MTASLTLRRCPFVDVASLDPATVCGLHLGLAEGMAEQIGGLTVDHLTHTDPRSAGCHLQVSFEDDNKRSEQ
ncbi:MAG: hypothetical protein M5U31_14915 [Acidimicrobiia bacterium]|nr:hypothetical protein [Acidimicrobiia bacterium]